MDKLRIGQKLSLSIILLIISKIISGVSVNKDIYYYIEEVLLLVLIFMPLFLVKREIPKKILSWVLLALSIPTITAIGSDQSNMNGVFFFLFSVTLSTKSIKIYVLYFTLFISALLYRFNNSPLIPSQIIEYVAGVYFLGIFYQHYIHPKPQSKQYIINYLDFPSKRYLIDVMLLYIQDKTWNEIAEILYPHKTGNALRKDVKKDLTKLEFESYADFVLYLGQNGIIKQVDKNTVT